MSKTADEPTTTARTIGWREVVDLPEWGIFGLRAKADTGARSSAIDVDHLEELDSGLVRFRILADRSTSEHGSLERWIEAPLVRATHVRSSFGRRRRRLFVATTLRVAGIDLECELGLVDRSQMLCRMLIGRRTLRNLLLVDSSRTYVHGRRKARLEEPAPRWEGHDTPPFRILEPPTDLESTS